MAAASSTQGDPFAAFTKMSNQADEEAQSSGSTNGAAFARAWQQLDTVGTLAPGGDGLDGAPSLRQPERHDDDVISRHGKLCLITARVIHVMCIAMLATGGFLLVDMLLND